MIFKEVPYKKIASLLVITYLKDHNKNLTVGILNKAIDSITWSIKIMVLPITIQEGKEYIENKYAQSYWNKVLNELNSLTTQDIINAREKL
jgi:hypothetical protein